MRIMEVSDNKRKKAIELRAGEREYIFPYAKLRVTPTASDPIEEIFADPDLGEEAFTYRLESGAEDTVHLDAVLDVNQDPDYLQELLLHELTVAAVVGLEESGIGKRQLARQLGTSPSQLYRLLDPENPNKSLGQMLALLHLVDRDVDLVVQPKLGSGDGRFEVFRDKEGGYRFRLTGGRGKLLLSSDSYSTRSGCLRAIRNVKAHARDTSFFERRTTARGKFRFRLRAKNHHVIAESPSFDSAAQRDAAISTVRRRARRTSVAEATG